jgi:hypothetical protein
MLPVALIFYTVLMHILLLQLVLLLVFLHNILPADSLLLWSFYPGKSKDAIILPDLSANSHHLIETAQVFKGTQNSKQYMMLTINFTFETLYSIMSLRMV